MATSIFGVGIPQIDFGILGELPQTYAQGQARAREEQFRRALSGLPTGAGGVPDYNAAVSLALRHGALNAVSPLAQIVEAQARRAHQAAALAETRRYHDAAIGLQRAQLDKPPQGYERTPEGGLRLIPGYAEGVQTLATSKDATGSLEPEQKLRKEFEGVSKPHLEVRRGYERVLASRDDAAGDIALIFGYMKMLDPGSVVREGEFATAQNAAGIPDQVRNMYNRALSGERLNPNQRTMFKGQAQSLYGASKNEYSAREQQFRSIAQQYRLDPDRIIPSLGPEPGARRLRFNPATGALE